MVKLKVWWGLAGLVLGLGVMSPGAGKAQEEKSLPSRKDTSAGGARLMSATITAVDAQAGTVTVQRRKGEVSTVSVTPETVILIGDEPGALANLQANAKAEISYREVEGKRVARWIRDALTVRIRNAESKGIRAVITALQAAEGTLTVRTDLGKVRELKWVAQGKNASRIMKQGQLADLTAFQINDPVMVSIRRTPGATLFLKGLADEVTFVAFLRDRCVEGQFRSLDAQARRMIVAPAAGEPVAVRFSQRTRLYRGGKEVQEPLFPEGQAVVVLYQSKEKGVIRARAVFDRDSWQAYALAMIAAEKGKQQEAEESPSSEE